MLTIWVATNKYAKHFPRKVNFSEPASLYGRSHFEISEALSNLGFQPGKRTGKSTAYLFFKDSPNGRMNLEVNYGGGAHTGGELGSGGGVVYDSPVYYKIGGHGTHPPTKVIDPTRYDPGVYGGSNVDKSFRTINGRNGNVIKKAGETYGP